MANNWEEQTIEQLQAPKKGAIAMGPFGSRIKAENFVNTGIPIIKGAQLHGTFLNDVSFDFLTQEKADELGSSKAYRGDIVITHRGTIGQVSVIPYNSSYETYIVSQSQLKVSLNTELINPYFAAYFLNSHLGQHRLLANSSQVGVPAIAKASTSVKQILIPVPELDLQNKIVKNLLSIDNKIELNRQTNQTLEQMAQALFKSWFVDFDPVIDNALAAGNALPDALQKRALIRKEMRTHYKEKTQQLDGFHPLPDGLPQEIRALFPSEFEQTDEPSMGIEGWIPKGWKVKLLSEITTELRRGISPKYVEEGGVQVINQKCIRNHEINFSLCRRNNPELKKVTGKELQLGDVLVNSTGVGTLGRVAQVNYLPESTVVDSHVTVVRPDFLIYPRYTFGQLMLTNEHRIETLGEGSTGQTELSRKILGELKVVLPPTNLTYVIEETFKSFVDKQTSNYIQASSLEKLRDTLLPKLISGEITIPTSEQSKH
ncbi:restriction endonuclease subunit S [Marinomonas sp. THO17]|uniref:restriction endonuclease subunit S n=1 Tax=Marinomonas sp. THO17 TaxID=3149048 RepID=UPI00336BB481